MVRKKLIYFLLYFTLTLSANKGKPHPMGGFNQHPPGSHGQQQFPHPNTMNHPANINRNMQNRPQLTHNQQMHPHSVTHQPGFHDTLTHDNRNIPPNTNMNRINIPSIGEYNLKNQNHFASD